MASESNTTARVMASLRAAVLASACLTNDRDYQGTRRRRCPRLAPRESTRRRARSRADRVARSRPLGAPFVGDRVGGGAGEEDGVVRLLDAVGAVAGIEDEPALVGGARRGDRSELETAELGDLPV